MVELWANASSDGLPVDTSHFAAVNGVKYAPLAQQTAPQCRGALIRACGHIVVDVPSLVGAVAQLRSHLRPHLRVVRTERRSR